MDLQKLRYDLAMQLATARFLAATLNGLEPEDDYMELLEIFSSCYEQYKKIPDSEFKALNLM